MANLSLIRELCKKRGITLSKLAKDLNISFSGLQGIIANNSTKIETLEKIADYLEVPVSYFFTNDPNTRIVFLKDDLLKFKEQLKMAKLQEYEGQMESFIITQEEGKKYINKEGVQNLLFSWFEEKKGMKNEVEFLNKTIAQNEKIIDLLYNSQKSKNDK